MRFSTPGAGLEPIKVFCTVLSSAVELDALSSPGIENRVICRAIGLQFVGWWETIHFQPFEDRLLEIFEVNAYFLAASVIQPSYLAAAKLMNSMCRNYRVAQSRTESKRRKI